MGEHDNLGWLRLMQVTAKLVAKLVAISDSYMEFDVFASRDEESLLHNDHSVDDYGTTGRFHDIYPPHAVCSDARTGASLLERPVKCCFAPGLADRWGSRLGLAGVS